MRQLESHLTDRFETASLEMRHSVQRGAGLVGILVALLVGLGVALSRL